MANSFLAAILSFLVPGLGQFYCGDLSKGIVFFVVAVAIAIVSFVVFRQMIYYIINVIVGLYAAYDAYNMAELNQRIWFFKNKWMGCATTPFIH